MIGSDLVRRLVTGFISGGLLLLLITRGADLLLAIVAAALGVISVLEFDLLFFQRPLLTRQLRSSLWILSAIFMLWKLPQFSWILVSVPMMIVAVRSVFQANHPGRAGSAIRDLSYEMLGFFYVVSIFGFLVPIATTGVYGRSLLLLLFFVVFLGDTAAFFAGRAWGRHRLASFISPKKSVEGAIAALVMAVIVGMVWAWMTAGWDWNRREILSILVFVPVMSVLGQFGDLFESLLKRSRAAKDSGTLLPGHGGLLDRVDGLALASPAFYLYLKCLEWIGP